MSEEKKPSTASESGDTKDAAPQGAITAPDDQAKSPSVVDVPPAAAAPSSSFEDRLRRKMLELCDRWEWRGPSREGNMEITIREARALAAEPSSSSASATTDAEDARRYRLIRSAYANEYRLRDAVKAEMTEQGRRGNLWQNGWCKDWPAYVDAVKRREEIVEEVANAPDRGDDR